MPTSEQLLRECLVLISKASYDCGDNNFECGVLIAKIKQYLGTKGKPIRTAQVDYGCKKEKKSGCLHELVHCSECGEELTLKDCRDAPVERPSECDHNRVMDGFGPSNRLICSKCKTKKDVFSPYS